MPSRILYILAAVVGLSILMSFWSRRKKATAWTGTVSDILHQRKNVARDEDRGDDDWVTIAYRTDEGAPGRLKLRMRLFRQFYPDLKTGDRLVKASGTFYPDVETTAAEAGPAPSE